MTNLFRKNKFSNKLGSHNLVNGQDPCGNFQGKRLWLVVLVINLHFIFTYMYANSYEKMKEERNYSSIWSRKQHAAKRDKGSWLSPTPSKISASAEGPKRSNILGASSLKIVLCRHPELNLPEHLLQCAVFPIKSWSIVIDARRSCCSLFYRFDRLPQNVARTSQR